MTVDFLISPSSEDDLPTRIKHLEGDFGAVITPGLDLAFRDREVISMKGQTLMGEVATREIPVCGPGAFVLLKALAFRSRGEAKDAYDLYYIVRNFGGGVQDVASRIKGLLPSLDAENALAILREDFTEANHAGPVRAASFSGEPNVELMRQDVVGFVVELLGAIT